MLFPWYTKYPYQNDEVLNLDWILKTIDNLVKEVSDFVSLNTIKYANPIQWNITNQYEKNTVVIDPISGTAYISTKPVPAGVGLNNTDYWDVIFTMDIVSANKNITLRDDQNNMLATFESVEGDWLLWRGSLYIVIRNIDIGQAYTEGYNIERNTVEAFLKLYISNLKDYVDNLVGSLSDLDTTDKDSVVDAINEVLSTLNTKVGDLDDLTTTDKDSVVDAINEVLSTINTLVGDLDDLTTTDKDSVVDAINELVTSLTTVKNSIGTLANLYTTDKSSLVNALNEVAAYCGDLDDLDTTVKTSLVAAINEVVAAIEDLQGGQRRRFIFISDSYGTNVNIQENWISDLVSYLGLSSGDYYANALTSLGFAISYDGKTFNTLLNEVYATVDEPDTITDIIVGGGFNDGFLSNYSAIVSAISQFISNAKTKFPKATVYVAHIGWSNRQADKTKLARISVPAYHQAEQLGGVYITNSEFIMHDYSLFQVDTTHPNSSGAQYIARCIQSYILGKNISVGRERETPTITPETGITSISNAWYVKQQNEITSICMFDNVITLSSPITLHYGDTITIGSLNSNLILGNNPADEFVRIPCNMQVTSSGNTFVIPCYVLIDGRTIKLKTFGWLPTGVDTNFVVSSITLFGLTAVIPTLYV